MQPYFAGTHNPCVYSSWHQNEACCVQDRVGKGQNKGMVEGGSHLVKILNLPFRIREHNNLFQVGKGGLSKK